MESISSLIVTIALQVSIVLLTGLSWVYAAFKFTHADDRTTRGK
ncbi:MAG TPA: hypothetical protein PKA61_02245 [Nitrospira sp.]|nr:hypothetical protein [Nitrospira sp.]